MSYLTFKLSDDFIQEYANKKVKWGFEDAGGNSLGEITFVRTYSRKKEDGTKERWFEVCRRVIEGMYSIQKDWASSLRLPWNDHKAQRSAQEAYDRLFDLKWSPPGRGLWVMGTPLTNRDKNSAALQNCAFVSTASMTKYDPAAPFCFLMEASMLGVGVGFDTKGADKNFEIYTPNVAETPFVIPDSREGWVQSVQILLNAYLMPKKYLPEFDYSEIRPAGEPIKTFGGSASGPEPLKKLHEAISKLFVGRASEPITTTDIVDVGNLIGVCVVAGNVRRSAELVLGSVEDEDFLNLKNWQEKPERTDWAWMSNNSVSVEVGQDLSPVLDGIALNGEPGVIWMDVSRQFGRLIDPANNKDWRAEGYNPCAEQTLESYEMCTLVETYLNRHESLEDFQRTLKFAYLYAKTVTLLPTHWPQTNAIMQRNRRIGASTTGHANFMDNNSAQELRRWLDAGYQTIQTYDKTYSEWLGIRESIKTTTVKPSGTVSILAGESPGVHWSPGGEYFNRAVRFSKKDPMVVLFQNSGYVVEDAISDPDGTVVVYFPVHSTARRSEKQVTIFEKAALAVEAQRWWSDNSVSVTLSFDAETEAKHVSTVLHMHEGQLKTVSFLPMGNEVYAQQPYTEITREEYEEAQMRILPLLLDDIYNGLGLDAIGEKYCTTDACIVEEFKNEVNNV